MLMQCVYGMQPERRERAKVGEALGATYASERSEGILKIRAQKAAFGVLYETCTLDDVYVCKTTLIRRVASNHTCRSVLIADC
jgi:hypothetical protein